MSRIRADRVTNKLGTGAPLFPNGIRVVGLTSISNIAASTGTFTGAVSIGGTLTYEDVTNVDSVGVITARSGIVATGVVTATSFAGSGVSNSANVTIASDESDEVSNSSIIFKTDGTEKVRIGNSAGHGCVGISTGVIDPDGNKLLIRGASTIGTNKGHIMLTGDGSTVGEGPQIVFSESGPGANWAGAYIGHTRQGSGSLGDLRFGTRATGGNADTAPTERLRISSDGAFGIGGANYGTSGQVLTSQGNAAAPQWADAGGGAWEIVARGSGTSASTFNVTLNGLTSTYEFYKLIFCSGGINHLASFDVTSDGGTTWGSAGSNQYQTTTGGQNQGGWQIYSDTTNTYGYIYGGPGTTNLMKWFDAEICFSGVHRTDRKHSFYSTFGLIEDGATRGGSYYSYVTYQQTTAINGIRLFMGDGSNNGVTVPRVTWSLLGMKLS